MTIPGLEIELIKAPIRLNMPIAGRRVQLAINSIEVHRAVSRVQVHLSLETRDFDFAVTRAQVDASLTRHLNDDVDLVLSPFDIEVMVRITDFNFYHVAILAFVNADSTFADLVPGRDDLGFDGVLIPGRHPDIRVRGLNPQIRSAGQAVGFGPLLGAGRHGAK